MEAKARFLGHPIHPMLVPIPLGLLTTAVAFDVVRLVTGNPFWGELSYWMIIVGVVGGLAAAVFGSIDWLDIPRHTRAWRIGLLHGVGNLIVVVAFAVSGWLRSESPGAPPALATGLAFMGIGLALVTGWLGGELVSRLGVGVAEGAHLDAPSSLAPPEERSALGNVGLRPQQRAGGRNVGAVRGSQ